MSSHPGPAAGPSLSISGASRILGVHPNTMRAWADQGRVRCLRVNARGDRRFRLDDLQAYVRTVGSRTPPRARRPRRPASVPAVEGLVMDLAEQLEPAGLVSALAAGARRTFGAHEVAVLRIRPGGALTAEPGSPPTPGPRTLADLAASGLTDPTSPGAERPTSAVLTEGPRGGSLAACRMSVAEQAPGILLVSRQGRRAWTPAELADLERLAAWAGIALRNARTYQRMAGWAAQLQSIQQLGIRLNRLTSVAGIGMAICSELRQLINYHNVRVYRVEGEDVVPIAWHGEIGEYIGEQGHELRLRVGEGITGWVARHGQAQYLPDAARDPRAATIPGSEPDLDESMLLAPMLYDDRVIGVIVLSKLGLDRFDADELRYLAIYASIAAPAMANAGATERLRAQSEALARQLDGQRELLRVTESILSMLDPVAVVEQIADRLGGLVPSDDLSVVVHEPGTGTLRPLLARGAHAEAVMRRSIPDDSGPVGWVMRHGEARLFAGRDLQAGSELGDGTTVSPGSSIVAPLHARQRTLGLLILERGGGMAPFSADELELIRLFAAHVSIALDNALAHRAVELRAQTDALTGLKNQGTLREELATAVARRAAFSLLMLDLDDFKAYNDACGHEAGNELLQGIADALRRACRAGDEVYRYGGDEFALVLPATGSEGALEVAERVRRAVRRTRDPGTGRPARLRCSVGVASFPADGTDGTQLLRAADLACYAAKRAGRDRVLTAAAGRALADVTMPGPTPVDDLPARPPR